MLDQEIPELVERQEEPAQSPKVDKGKILVVGGHWTESRFRPFAERGFDAVHVDTTHWGKNSVDRVRALISKQKLVAMIICQGHISHMARDVAVSHAKLHRVRWLYVHKATDTAFSEALDKIEGALNAKP